MNTIWVVGKEDGTKETSHNDMDEDGMTYYWKSLNEPKGLVIEYQLRVIHILPRLFYEDLNGSLEAIVTKEELLVSMNSFKK